MCACVGGELGGGGGWRGEKVHVPACVCVAIYTSMHAGMGGGVGGQLVR